MVLQQVAVPVADSMLRVIICRYSFFVAGLAQPWHWGFHSCNGLSADGDHDKWGGPYEVLHLESPTVPPDCSFFYATVAVC